MNHALQKAWHGWFRPCYGNLQSVVRLEVEDTRRRCTSMLRNAESGRALDHCSMCDILQPLYGTVFFEIVDPASYKPEAKIINAADKATAQYC